jgi:hypothetical protein
VAHRNYRCVDRIARIISWAAAVVKIHHSRPGNAFVIIPNGMARDESLSLAARGHLAYLLSLPDGWSTTADAESKRARSLRGKRGEGRDAMRRIYSELKDAGYVYYERRNQDDGTWSTEIHVSDEPRTEAEWKTATDARLTDIPETRMSAPPAETPEVVDNSASEFSQVAPMYGSPGVGSPDVGSPVHREAVRSYEDGTTEDWEDEGQSRVGDGVDDEEQPVDAGTGPQSIQVANSQNRRVHNFPETGADEAQGISRHDSESATASHHARRRDTAPAVGTDPIGCEYEQCPVPEKPLPAASRHHIGCGLAM